MTQAALVGSGNQGHIKVDFYLMFLYTEGHRCADLVILSCLTFGGAFLYLQYLNWNLLLWLEAIQREYNKIFYSYEVTAYKMNTLKWLFILKAM